MSELTTGGINFGYDSPIHRIFGDISTQIIQDGENQIFQAIQKSGVVVNKPELIKALQYDRNQYNKGYSDGRASIVKELEKIKAEIEDMGWDIYKTERKVPHKYVEKERIYELLDNHIKELKGENK